MKSFSAWENRDTNTTNRPIHFVLPLLFPYLPLSIWHTHTFLLPLFVVFFTKINSIFMRNFQCLNWHGWKFFGFNSSLKIWFRVTNVVAQKYTLNANYIQINNQILSINHCSGKSSQSQSSLYFCWFNYLFNMKLKINSDESVVVIFRCSYCSCLIANPFQVVGMWAEDMPNNQDSLKWCQPKMRF